MKGKIGMTSEDVIKSPTFCVYPWLEQVVQANGTLSFCCVGKNGGQLNKNYHSLENKFDPFVAGRDPLKEAWNSEHLKSIRRDMVKGQKRKECGTCYFQESIGKTSYRQMHNQEWLADYEDEIESRIQESLDNEMNLSHAPLYLDLRLGNICNLKCRSCGPVNSIQIQKEHEKLISTNAPYDTFQKQNQIHPYVKTNNEWVKSSEFWQEITSNLPQIKKIYLTGGEPTLIEKNYEFIKTCVDLGYAKDIFLMFNTNCTNMPDRFLDCFQHFKFVLVNASLDGVGTVNEYIREGSQWEDVVKNLRRLLNVKGNVQVGVTPVVQVYNSLALFDLLEFVEKLAIEFKKTINVDFLYATSPSFLDIRILPQDLKIEMQKRMIEFKEKSKFYQVDQYLTNSIDSYLNLLSTDMKSVQWNEIQAFKKYTEFLDVQRNRSFNAIFPKLVQYLTQSTTEIRHERL